MMVGDSLPEGRLNFLLQRREAEGCRRRCRHGWQDAIFGIVVIYTKYPALADASTKVGMYQTFKSEKSNRWKIFTGDNPCRVFASISQRSRNHKPAGINLEYIFTVLDANALSLPKNSTPLEYSAPD